MERPVTFSVVIALSWLLAAKPRRHPAPPPGFHWTSGWTLIVILAFIAGAVWIAGIIWGHSREEGWHHPQPAARGRSEAELRNQKLHEGRRLSTRLLIIQRRKEPRPWGDIVHWLADPTDVLAADALEYQKALEAALNHFQMPPAPEVSSLDDPAGGEAQYL